MILNFWPPDCKRVDFCWVKRPRSWWFVKDGSPEKLTRGPAFGCMAGCGGYLVGKSCLTPCNPMDCSPPGSFVQRISQVKILECGAISSPGAPPYPGIAPRSSVSPRLHSVYHCASWEAHTAGTSSLRCQQEFNRAVCLHISFRFAHPSPPAPEDPDTPGVWRKGEETHGYRPATGCL